MQSRSTKKLPRSGTVETCRNGKRGKITYDLNSIFDCVFRDGFFAVFAFRNFCFFFLFFCFFNFRIFVVFLIFLIDCFHRAITDLYGGTSFVFVSMVGRFDRLWTRFFPAERGRRGHELNIMLNMTFAV